MTGLEEVLHMSGPLGDLARAMVDEKAKEVARMIEDYILYGENGA